MAVGPRIGRADPTVEHEHDLDAWAEHRRRALGRPFVVIAHNGLDESDDPILFETRTVLDIEGNNLGVLDANTNTAEENTFAAGGLKLKTDSQDAGARWALPDAQGRPLRTWDSRDNVRRFTYDALNRPTHAYLKHDTDDEVLQQRIVYGESLGVSADDTNHRGQLGPAHRSRAVESARAWSTETSTRFCKRPRRARTRRGGRRARFTWRTLEGWYYAYQAGATHPELDAWQECDTPLFGRCGGAQSVATPLPNSRNFR